MDRGDAGAMTERTRVALTIAGSNSGAGAGVQADIRTFAALGVYGASVITAVTAQNTRGVRAVHAMPPEIVRAQIAAVLDDFDVAAIKIGMLADAGVVGAVAAALSPPSPRSGEGVAEGDGWGVESRTHEAQNRANVRASRRASAERPTPHPSASPPPSPAKLEKGSASRRAFIVFDPVLAASSGDALAATGLIEAVRAHLLPLVDCLTPNLAEAAALLARDQARTEVEMIEQGHALLALGPGAVLMKGGHLPGDEAIDLLVTAAGLHRFAAPKVASANTHGTGCTLSSAIAAYRVRGLPLVEAVAAAKAFVREAIERGASLALGAGPGPVLQAPLVALAPTSGDETR